MDGNWIWRDFLANAYISRELAEILDRMILAPPSQRYQTAQAVLDDLKNANSSSYQVYVPRLAKSEKKKVISKTNFSPVSTPKRLTQIIALQLSQFSFETATVKINCIGVGKLTKTLMQIHIKQK
ncbi:MAG: hypothetical protein ACKPFK_34890, partial [Dolichospermum sp.]